MVFPTVTKKNWNRQRRGKLFPISASGIILDVLIITIVVMIVNVVGMSTVLKANTIGRRGCYRRVLFQHRSSSSSSSSTLSATTRRHVDNDTNTINNTIQFIDATWFHKGIRNGRKEFENGPRLPGAVHWDISDLSTNGELFPNDNPKKLKNVFPSQWLVGAALEKMGVINTNNNSSSNNKSTTTETTKTMLVVYGREGTFFAPRVWYTLKKYYCGSGSVKLLQGSLEEWIAKGGPADFDPITTATNTMTTKDRNSTRKRNDNNSIEPATNAVSIRAKDLLEEFGPRWRDNRYKHPSISWSTAKNRLVDMQFVLDFLDYKQKQRKEEEEEEEDDELSSSSMLKEELDLLVSSPSSSNRNKNDSSNDKWPSIIIDTRGSSFSKKGHIPVCTMALALEELGLPEPFIYDGSWNEWGQDPSTPKAGISK
ncbi:hypothetical protein FRACYDRAFT_240613 [Fragilariopsis cylindrus CCMP1102]|uniref:Rhodanese domain-containing protein n=1 Tax=Fragilariopsis cylindrus CCMP1102 TaxID=635003 RepID=A0A1E7FCL6_9STRA|nr:hypothetical protein FRACYDRAFT_240613 [Fragilariopsis cylindrus CCMP1102]|eukprot:OEU15918.1 hypothetical protein FRACYDRAFT_240613 [Fragilariopsis cylindrus CCMP1102]